MKLYTRKEVAEMFGIHTKTIDKWHRDGLLPHYKLGDLNGDKNRTVRYSAKDIEEFLAARHVGSKKATP